MSDDNNNHELVDIFGAKDDPIPTWNEFAFMEILSWIEDFLYALRNMVDGDLAGQERLFILMGCRKPSDYTVLELFDAIDLMIEDPHLEITDIPLRRHLHSAWRWIWSIRWGLKELGIEESATWTDSRVVEFFARPGVREDLLEVHRDLRQANIILNELEFFSRCPSRGADDSPRIRRWNAEIAEMEIRKFKVKYQADIDRLINMLGANSNSLRQRAQREANQRYSRNAVGRAIRLPRGSWRFVTESPTYQSIVTDLQIGVQWRGQRGRRIGLDIALEQHAVRAHQHEHHDGDGEREADEAEVCVTSPAEVSRLMKQLANLDPAWAERATKSIANNTWSLDEQADKLNDAIKAAKGMNRKSR
jgi:hypothetical protein